MLLWCHKRGLLRGRCQRNFFSCVHALCGWWPTFRFVRCRLFASDATFQWGRGGVGVWVWTTLTYSSVSKCACGALLIFFARVSRLTCGKARAPNIDGKCRMSDGAWCTEVSDTSRFRKPSHSCICRFALRRGGATWCDTCLGILFSCPLLFLVPPLLLSFLSRNKFPPHKSALFVDRFSN